MTRVDAASIEIRRAASRMDSVTPEWVALRFDELAVVS